MNICIGLNCEWLVMGWAILYVSLLRGLYPHLVDIYNLTIPLGQLSLSRYSISKRAVTTSLSTVQEQSMDPTMTGTCLYALSIIFYSFNMPCFVSITVLKHRKFHQLVSEPIRHIVWLLFWIERLDEYY